MTLTPATISLVAGEVSPLAAAAVNSANTAVTVTFTFNSSNTKVATISPGGQVCAGVWDSLFVVCNGIDAQNNPISGTATITATGGGVTSGPVLVSVHPSVTAVTVDAPTAPCFSIDQTHQFVPHVFHNTQDITSEVGPISWSSSEPSASSIDANGLATAHLPGLSAVVASVGATSSPAVFFRSCLPVLISLHVAGDPAGTVTTSVNLNTTNTTTVQADMIDELGTVTANAPLTFLSNNPTVATVAGDIVTAVSPGNAGLQAVCAPPNCGVGINTPIYSNLFSVSVNGTSPITTTVYATTSFFAGGTSTIPVVPIDISKTPPVVGTAIDLPGVPTSMVFNRTGTTAYLGTNAGLVLLNPTANTVSLVTPVPIGKVLAVSTDGNEAIISNAANDPGTNAPIDPSPSEQRVWLFNQSANTITTFVLPGAVAAAFDDDGFRAYAVANNGNVYVISTLLTQVTTSVPGATSNLDISTLASGPFNYVASSPGGLKAIATCSNAVQSTSIATNSTAIQLVGSAKSANQIFAVDSPGVDVETVNVTNLTPPLTITPANCQPNVSYSNTFVNFGIPFTAHQLLVSPSGIHAAVLPAGINKVFTVFNGNGPGFAQLPAGATEALSGGMTPDGTIIWVGVGGTNSVDRINLLDNIDDIQVPMSFKKSDGTPAPPNIVTIRPQ